MTIAAKEEQPPVLSYWPYCETCEQPYWFDAEEPIATCDCHQSEWGHPRPASYVLNPHTVNKAAMCRDNISIVTMSFQTDSSSVPVAILPTETALRAELRKVLVKAGKHTVVHIDACLSHAIGYVSYPHFPKDGGNFWQVVLMPYGVMGIINAIPLKG